MTISALPFSCAGSAPALPPHRPSGARHWAWNRARTHIISQWGIFTERGMFQVQTTGASTVSTRVRATPATSSTRDIGDGPRFDAKGVRRIGLGLLAAQLVGDRKSVV